MSVALLFVSHQDIAGHLLNLCCTLHDEKIQNYAVVEVPLDTSVDEKLDEAKNKLSKLNLDDGLIIVTDIFGGTPSNIAQTLSEEYNAPMVSGLNLPMLVRLNNYRDAPLATLLDKAISGGQQGVMLHVNEDH